MYIHVSQQLVDVMLPLVPFVNASIESQCAMHAVHYRQLTSSVRVAVYKHLTPNSINIHNAERYDTTAQNFLFMYWRCTFSNCFLYLPTICAFVWYVVCLLLRCDVAACSRAPSLIMYRSTSMHVSCCRAVESSFQIAAILARFSLLLRVLWSTYDGVQVSRWLWQRGISTEASDC
jgi:hypothetical protein